LPQRIRTLAFCSAMAFVATSCASVASPVGNAAFYTDVKGPIDAEAATGATKQGRACAANYVGAVALGDASIEAAKRHGGITSVSVVDHESWNVLGVYSRFCTLVVGE
jgi:hypothetical protein